MCNLKEGRENFQGLSSKLHIPSTGADLQLRVDGDRQHGPFGRLERSNFKLSFHLATAESEEEKQQGIDHSTSFSENGYHLPKTESKIFTKI